STTVTPTHSGPYRTFESAEALSFKEFSLIEVRQNFKVTYRFPRINEKERTLVELMVKNELPEGEEGRGNKVVISVPNDGGQVTFKCQEVSVPDVLESPH